MSAVRGYGTAGFTDEEVDEIASAMVEADGLSRDNPSFPVLWPAYQTDARRLVAGQTKLREIRRRKGNGKLNRSLLGA